MTLSCLYTQKSQQGRTWKLWPYFSGRLWGTQESGSEAGSPRGRGVSPWWCQWCPREARGIWGDRGNSCSVNAQPLPQSVILSGVRAELWPWLSPRSPFMKSVALPFCIGVYCRAWDTHHIYVHGHNLLMGSWLWYCLHSSWPLGGSISGGFALT